MTANVKGGNTRSYIPEPKNVRFGVEVWKTAVKSAF